MKDPLAEARDALERHAWSDALDLFRRADQQLVLEGPDFEKLAEVAFFNGQADLAIEAKERAFKWHLAAGDQDRAAALAVDLCREYLYKGRGSIGAAWLRRAERLLEGRPESYAQGYLALAHADQARQGGEVEAAIVLAEKAVRLGSEFGDADLQAHGLSILGTINIATGKVPEGLDMLQEATVAATNGELSPIIAGIIYCRMIGVCRDLSDYARAGEWTEATTRWCDQQSIAGFPGICRVHRAEVVALTGGWDQAEKELEQATRELADYNATPPLADAYYALAQIRFRRGDVADAESALRQAHGLGKSPQPLLALIRLAQGNSRAAATAIKSALDEQSWDLWARVRLLPAQVEIAVAAGDGATARAAAEELEQLVETYDAAAVQAESEAAWGRVLLAEGDSPSAARHFRRAIEKWGAFYAPFEVAIVRHLLSLALRSVGDEDAADLEIEAARADLERLGAVRMAQVVASDIEASAARRSGPVQARRTFLFTDIVGSTNLAELLGDSAWDQLLRWHDEALRTAFGRSRGTVVNSTGDGFFVAFDSAIEAVDAAVAIQRLLDDHRRSTGFAPAVRIGLHTAEANQVGDDYSGVGVHVAARVAALAEGGEILATSESLVEVGARGTQRRAVTLKGVSTPVDVESIDWSTTA